MLDRHLRLILDEAHDGVLVESRDRVAYINVAYARLLGYPSTTEFHDISIRDIAHPEDLEQLTWFGRCRLQGKPAPTRYTFRAIGRGGDVVSFDASISQTRIDGEFFITTVVRELQPHADATPRDLTLPGTRALSAREREVMQHLLAGRRSKEIAAILGVSEKTICTHRSRIFQKLALRGDRDLFRRAAELGLMAG